MDKDTLILLLNKTESSIREMEKSLCGIQGFIAGQTKIKEEIIALIRAIEEDEKIKGK